MNKMELGGVFLYQLHGGKVSKYYSGCRLNDLKNGHYFGNKQALSIYVVRLAVF